MNEVHAHWKKHREKTFQTRRIANVVVDMQERNKLYGEKDATKAAEATAKRHAAADDVFEELTFNDADGKRTTAPSDESVRAHKSKMQQKEVRSER